MPFVGPHSRNGANCPPPAIMAPRRPASRDTCRLWGSFRPGWSRPPAAYRPASGNGVIATVVEAPTGNDFQQIDFYDFDDGTEWTASGLAAAVIAASATDGDDSIEGFWSADTLAGGLGDDSLSGLDGSDTYVFTRGDGKDTIEDNGSGDTDVLLIHDYVPDDVTVERISGAQQCGQRRCGWLRPWRNGPRGQAPG